MSATQTTNGDNKMTNRQNRILMASNKAAELVRAGSNHYDAADSAATQFGLLDEEAFDAICRSLAIDFPRW